VGFGQYSIGRDVRDRACDSAAALRDQARNRPAPTFVIETIEKLPDASWTGKVVSRSSAEDGATAPTPGQHSSVASGPKLASHDHELTFDRLRSFSMDLDHERWRGSD
jgi:hypothetical protein